MVNVTADLRLMLPDFGEPVTLPGGTVVLGIPGVASQDDALTGDAIVAGRTRTLRMATADAPDLKLGESLTWNGKAWRVNSIQLVGLGHAMTVFLGSV